MSGSGRKSQYRKSVTSAYLLEDERCPQDNEYIVSIVSNRGDSTFAIQFPANYNDNTGINTELANLPKKFNKLIWIKSGDHVIVEDNNFRLGVANASGESEANATGSSNKTIKAESSTASILPGNSKVRFTITHILSKGNIKYLKAKGLWPFVDTNNEPFEAVSNKTRAHDTAASYTLDDYNDEYDVEPEEYDSMGNTIINSN